MSFPEQSLYSADTERTDGNLFQQIGAMDYAPSFNVREIKKLSRN